MITTHSGTREIGQIPSGAAQTAEAVRRSDVPLALPVIQREHVSITRALDGIAQAIGLEGGRGVADIDLAAVGTMLAYLDAFPEQLHHPKEDRYLFARLQARCPSAAAVLQPLQAEHTSSAGDLDFLQRRLRSLSENDVRGLRAFRRELARFDQSYRRHIRIEEDVVLPLALHYLTEQDWRMIDAAFSSNLDPVSSGEPIDAFHARMREALALIDTVVKQGAIGESET